MRLLDWHSAQWRAFWIVVVALDRGARRASRSRCSRRCGISRSWLDREAAGIARRSRTRCAPSRASIDIVRQVHHELVPAVAGRRGVRGALDEVLCARRDLGGRARALRRRCARRRGVEPDRRVLLQARDRSAARAPGAEDRGSGPARAGRPAAAAGVEAPGHGAAHDGRSDPRDGDGRAAPGGAAGRRVRARAAARVARQRRAREPRRVARTRPSSRSAVPGGCWTPRAAAPSRAATPRARPTPPRWSPARARRAARARRRGLLLVAAQRARRSRARHDAPARRAGALHRGRAGGVRAASRSSLAIACAAALDRRARSRARNPSRCARRPSASRTAI